MIVDKEIVSKIPRDYIFITGGFDIDPKYLKQRIEEGVKESKLNYKTNVVGKHTEWKFFNKDKHSYLSGVLYLHDHSQKLYFPDIKQEITPTTGRFVLFSSFLNHYTKRNLEDKEKYAISFNFKSVSIGDKF